MAFIYYCIPHLESPNGFIIKPSWTDFKELKDQLHNLEEYITELLEWTDTAFATLYPHDDLILVNVWRVH